MRLLFCIKAMNNPGGGAERVLADVANGLSRRGHQVGLLTFEAEGSEPFYVLDPGIEQIWVGIGSTSRRARFGETLARIGTLRRSVRGFSPDAAIGFMVSAYLPLGFAALGTGTPVIASEHNVPERYQARPLLNALMGLTPFIVARMTAVSEQARELYSVRLRQKMSVVPNPIAATSLGQASVSADPQATKVLLSVGRLVDQKDHRTLIRAFAAVAQEFPDWRLRIIGDGELRDDLVREIAAVRLEDRIDLAGTTRSISEEYSRAQLFAMASRYESFGLATAEALASGLPVVGFADCPGTNELVSHGENGLLVDGGDRVAALAQGIGQLMANETLRLRMSKAAAATRHRFDVERVLDAWELLLAEVQNARAEARR